MRSVLIETFDGVENISRTDYYFTRIDDIIFLDRMLVLEKKTKRHKAQVNFQKKLL